jgi:hypothetical protein
MVTDPSGNLGLGVTPSAWSGAISSAFEAKNGSSLAFGFNTLPVVYLSSNYYFDGTARYKINGTAAQYAINNNVGSHIWYTAPSGTAGNAISFTQAMTLDASGNLLVGITSTPASFAGVALRGRVVDNFGLIYQNQAGTQTCGFYNSTAGTLTIEFRNASGTSVGTIVTTSVSTAYNTSSDYRLKNTIAPMTGALARVAALKPCTYKWNVDGSDGEGFIAHELAEVCPQAVTGEKDAVDADGNPKYQGIDTSFLVATLTAAIQELKADLDATKAELAALKGQQ